MNGRDTHPWSTRLLLGMLLAALLLLRSPGSLLHPQFWAEDGTVFFQDAFNHGFLRTVLQPASGYLHMFPRLVAGFALLFPLEWAPLVFNLAAFAVQLLPAFYLLGPRMARVIPSFPARVVAALLYVSLPASYETHVNLTNAHWHLALTAVCVLAAAPPAGARVRALESSLMALFAVTGPFSIFFLPLVAPGLLGILKGARTVRSQIVPLVVAAGAAIQLGFALTSARIGAAAPSGTLSLQELLTIVSMHTFFNPVFGIHGVLRFQRLLPPIALGLGLAALGFLLLVAVRDRVKPLLTLFYLAALSVTLAFVFPLNDVRLWLHPQAGPRYFLFACVFVAFAALHLACAAPSFRMVGRVLLAAVVAIGIPADFFHPGQPDVRWADHAAVFRSLPAGTDFFVPVVPLYHQGMTLHKSSPRQDPPPLSLLRPAASPAAADFSVSRPAKLGLAGAGNERFLVVAGWAIDAAARRPARGVYVIIDDKVFPAVLGLPANVSVDGRSYAESGFSRLIPIDEIGPGPHQVTIAVLTSDGTGYYRPPAPQTFTTSQFFPSQAAEKP